MKPNELNSAIRKLKLAHKYGRRIVKLLDKGDGKQFRKVGYRDAAEAISGDSVTISEASARHYATFARRYTTAELDQLVMSCEHHRHAPSFDVVVRLIAVRDKKVRKSLLHEVLVNRWNKIRLGQEMRNRSVTAAFEERDARSQIERRNRGRKPRAVSSVENLLGELHDDAIKWRRIHRILMKQVESESDDSVGRSIDPKFLEEIEELADTLNRFFDWEI